MAPSGSIIRRRRSCYTTTVVRPIGIHTWSDRIADDEIQLVDGMPATTPARTAFDLACRNPVGKAVAAIDALARATRLKVADAELLAERYKGHRNIRRAQARTDARRRRRGVTARDLAAAAGHRGRLSAAADPDTGLRRVWRACRRSRYGLGGRQNRRSSTRATTIGPIAGNSAGTSHAIEALPETRLDHHPGHGRRHAGRHSGATGNGLGPPSVNSGRDFVRDFSH